MMLCLVAHSALRLAPQRLLSLSSLLNLNILRPLPYKGF